MANDARLRSLQGFVFDMDGVMYRGSQAVPGAGEFIAALRGAGIPFLFATNNSTTPPHAVAARLQGMGIHVVADEILSSAEATARALQRHVPAGRVLVLGEEGIREALRLAGYELTDDHKLADAVVVGLDRKLTYAALERATWAVRDGALLMATNSDRTFPTEDRLSPGAGSVLAAVEAATDTKAIVIGKPSPVMFEQALERMGTEAGLTACVGDRADTDIVGGQRAGMPTIAVLTGVGTRADFAALPQPPDWVFEDLRGLQRAYLG